MKNQIYTYRHELKEVGPVPKKGLMYRLTLGFLVSVAGLSFFVAYTWPKHSPFNKVKQAITTDSVQFSGEYHKEKKYTK